jgi:hypothetical protein
MGARNEDRAMRIFNGFDRIATEEELSQVFDILTELERNGWLLDSEPSTYQAGSLWADSISDPCANPEALAALMDQRPELKN